MANSARHSATASLIAAGESFYRRGGRISAASGVVGLGFRVPSTFSVAEMDAEIVIRAMLAEGCRLRHACWATSPATHDASGSFTSWLGTKKAMFSAPRARYICWQLPRFAARVVLPSRGIIPCLCQSWMHFWPASSQTNSR